MSSPRNKLKFERITAKQFKELTDKLRDQLKSTVTLARGVYSMKPTEKSYTLQGTNLVYTRGDIRKAFSAINRAINDLSAYYRVSMQKKSTKKASLNSGLRKPTAVDETMMNFIKTGNFGNRRFTSTQLRLIGKVDGSQVEKNVDVAVDSGQLLINQLELLTNNFIGTPIMFNALFNIYVARNGLVALAQNNQGKNVTDHNGIVFGADPLMKQLFGDTFTRMTRDSQQALLDLGVKDGDPRPTPTKNGAIRRYYKKVTVNGIESLDQNKPIYNDFYHVFSPDNIPRSAINTIIKFHKLQGNDDLFKLLDNEAKAYTAEIDTAMAAGQLPTYQLFAQSASAKLGLAADTSGGQRLLLRGQSDTEASIVRSTSKSYRATVSQQ
uniref:Uncharacterized protein n=1 Tax=Pithovirus LCPAC102 TaxID=2506587 RepID=A0A4D5XFI3_9VIRU|nr:MAG: hypothetical protein LCPAC102_01910 [Pithovirus LCPAC102]